MFSPVACPVAGRCAACAWIEVPYEDQLARKREAVRGAATARGLDPAELGAIPIDPVAAAATRDRADLQFRRDSGGLRFGFAASRDDGSREFVDVERCPQAVPALEAWIGEFRALVPPVGRGSVRLRVAPDGTRGVWLDLANVDVKHLFDERHALAALAERAIVEIGQRRKRLVFADGRPTLAQPEPYPWFATFAGAEAVPVYSAVGGFTQPGIRGNEVLVRALLRAVPERSGRWLELGAGVGNFTVPLVFRGLSVTAVENDPIALLGLRKTLGTRWTATVCDESFSPPGKRLSEALGETDGVVADPPRSGLGNFADALATAGPAVVVYVSCYPESFAADAAKLLSAGYRLRSLEGVDQFPQTPHLELVARFER